MSQTILNSCLVLSLLLSVISCGISESPKAETPSTPEIKVNTTEEIDANSKLWDKTTAKAYLPISKLKRQKSNGAIYETEGYIVDSVPICDCPPDYDCDCNTASITISEQNKKWHSKELGETEILIFTDPEKFRSDQKYRFKIRVEKDELDSEPRQYVDLIAYRKGKKASN